MKQKQIDKIINRAISFIEENTNSDSSRIAQAILSELDLVKKVIIPPSNKQKSEIVLRKLQIKSLSKAKKLAEALSIIEEECGIKNVKITMENMFFCGWIDLDELDKTEMERLLQVLIKRLI